MADSAISGLTTATSPTSAAWGVIADGTVDYKISLPNMVKAGGGLLLSVAQVSGTLSITGAYTSGTATYGPTAVTVPGTATFGTLSLASVSDNGANTAIFSAASGMQARLQANAGAANAYINIGSAGNASLGVTTAAYTVGSSSYGATAATINGTLTIAGALTGATTGGFSGIVTASRFNGSGAGLTAATVPNASLVTSPVTAVTASGSLTSSGGLTPNITLNSTLALTSITLSTALAIISGGTGSSTQNVVDLTTAQTKVGVLTLSSPPVMSGASITVSTIPMASLTGTLAIVNGGTGAVTLAASPFVVLNPAAQQTGSLSISGNINIGGGYGAGSSTYGATSMTLSNGATNVVADYGTTLNNALTFNKPVNVTGSIAMSYSFMRNKIINGTMVIDQRNNGASVTPSTGTSQYIIDRWFVSYTQASKLAAGRNLLSLPGIAGYPFCLGVKGIASYTPLATDNFFFGQAIEGVNTSDFMWGTANAQPITLTFEAVAYTNGTLCVSLHNYGVNNRSYVTTYTVLTGAVPNRVTITIPGDTSGTWTNGMVVAFSMGAGTNFQTATVNAWQAGNVYTTSSAIAPVTAPSGYVFITAVQVESGTLSTQYETRHYGTELQLCQRYCYATAPTTLNGMLMANGAFSSTTNAYVYYRYAQTMRAAASLTVVGTFAASSGSASYTISALSSLVATVDGTMLQATVTGATATQPAMLVSSTTSSQLIFSAEL